MKNLNRISILILVLALISFNTSDFFDISRADFLYSENGKQPLLISLNINGWFAKGFPWNLEITNNGKATLIIKSYPKHKKKSFIISPNQLKQLKEVIEREGFYDLNEEYGDLVPDGDTRIITINQGNQRKTVKLHYLLNLESEGKKGKEKLIEACRAIRIWMLVTSWFNDPDAVDIRKYDQRILDTVKNEKQIV
jgi:hypothetical protein